MMIVWPKTSYHFTLQSVDLLHHSRVQLDGFSDVGQDLFVGMGRLLVQKDPHSFAGLHAAPHHRHKLRTNEVLDFAALWCAGLGAAQRRRPAGRRGRGLDVHRPVGVHVFCVIQLLVSFNRAAHIAVTCWNEWREGRTRRGVTYWNIRGKGDELQK